ncbi:hypothetical protein [Mucilaginibacter sp.]|uniref:hypothetical protein n=1 Tax=Mucilaginibacter sp. TaxID=1882438 RepID=UPI0032637FB0
MNNDPLNILDAAAAQSNPSQGNDELANQENNIKFREGERGESYRTHIHRIIICFMYIMGFCFTVLTVVRAWDFIAPENLKWLSEAQDHDLERILFSGIILSFASKYFKKYNIVEN